MSTLAGCPHQSQPADQVSGVLWQAGRLALEVVPVWLAVLVVLPWLVPGGSGDPWSPMQPALRGLWYAQHRLAAGDELYLVVDPVAGAGFSLSPVGALVLRPMLLGTLVGWQVLWPLLGAAAQQVVLRRLGLPGGLWLGLIGVAVALLLAPVRAAFGQGGAGLLMWAMVLADVLPARDRHGRLVPGSGRFGLPPGALVGLAAAMQMGPLSVLVMLLVAGERRMARNGLVTFAVAVTSACLALPFDSWRFISLAWQGRLHLFAEAVDPRIVAGLPASTQTAPWPGLIIAVVVVGAAIGASSCWWRQGLAVALVGLGMALALPPQWSGGGLWAVLVLAVLVLDGQALPGRGWSGWWRWPMLAWAVWELGAPADLVTGVAWQGVGVGLGLLAVLGAGGSVAIRTSPKRSSEWRDAEPASRT